MSTGIVEKPKVIGSHGRKPVLVALRPTQCDPEHGRGVAGRPGTARPARGGPASGRQGRDGTPPAKAPPAENRSVAALWPGRRGASEQDLVNLCRHLAALVGSGVGLAECLRTFAEETRTGTFRAVLEEVMADLEAGRKLSDAFARHPEHFSPYFCASIWAGEATGTMAETLDRLARYLEGKQEMRQRVRTAFAYPIALVAVAASVVTFLLLYVVPVFAGVYGRMGVPLPWITQLLVDASGLVLAYPYLPALPLAGAVAAVLWVRRSREGRLWFDGWKVRLPVVGPLFRQMVLYRFVRTFGEAMGAGVPVLEALDLAGRVTGNAAFIARLELVREDVKRGAGLTEPLRRTGWFSASLLQVISSGEQSGRVPALLGRTAEIIQRDLDLGLKRAVGRIEPILTVAMAVVVGAILLAVYLPMFDVMQHVGK